MRIRSHSLALAIVFVLACGLNRASAFQITAVTQAVSATANSTPVSTTATFSVSRDMKGEYLLGYNMSCLLTGSSMAETAGPKGTVSFNDVTEKTLLGTAMLGADTTAFVGRTLALPAGSAPSAFATGDFNKDGKLDLAVTLQNGDVAILLGNGDGTFQKTTIYSITYFQNILVGDFNGDGKLDVAGAGEITNQGVIQAGVSILQGNGDGAFQSEKLTSLPSSLNATRAAVAGDFNGDGRLDLALGYSNSAAQPGYTGALAILFGKGDGTFQAPITSSLPTNPPANPFPLIAADFNKDGKTDLVLDDPAYLLLSNGDGTFQPSYLGYGSAPVAVADFNGDGNPDIAFGGDTGLSVLLGDGKGGLTQMASYSTPNATFLVTGDFNGDGRADVLVNDGSREGWLYLGNGDGTLQSPIMSTTFFDGPLSIEAADFQKAGFADLVILTLNQMTGVPNVMIMLPAGQATATATAVRVPAGTATSHTLDCTYAGDQSYAGSTSNTGTVTFLQSPPPYFSLATGPYAAPQTVSISDAVQGATINYTTDGSTPTLSSPVYTKPITVAVSETLKAISSRTYDYAESEVVEAVYTIGNPAASPTFSPAPGTFAGSTSVSISDTAPGAKIYYTTNGATPTTSSTLYSKPIPVTSTETIQAIAIATGDTQSLVSSGTYTIEQPAAAPVFSPTAGAYAGSVSVSITDATAGAKIYYSFNGATPTTSSTLYSAPITVTATETVKAIAVATGYTQSSVTSATYTIEKPTATPTFSPKAGSFGAEQLVTISDATAGAAIYYTLNGSSPTTASTKYTAPIAIAESETVKAIAAAPGFSNSAVYSATYTVAGTPVVLTGQASGITASGATLNALVNPQGVAATYNFQYGLTSAASGYTTAKETLAATSSSAAVSASLTGLTAKTTYYFRAVVSTVGGSSTSAVGSFTTE